MINTQDFQISQSCELYPWKKNACITANIPAIFVGTAYFSTAFPQTLSEQYTLTNLAVKGMGKSWCQDPFKVLSYFQASKMSGSGQIVSLVVLVVGVVMKNYLSGQFRPEQS